MKTFLTLLTAITSLSVYTLVGVHAAGCATCPASVSGMGVTGKCHPASGVTRCR
ncbi:hypothetical protein PAXRUDRAFT_163963 [Paxillus rubicundulus Ve08.2h10]|uniref:Uncharacterized protein n=1 Tax=Paxillus rubicundulus Ve08.2h10 TaxID=930991 RepID=A0A0D0DCS5_9AGAM|nr:hypothetical protein PAXRUDRAFT_163963 [Paxillus rubicundulus Ve08.2h10]